VIDSALFLVVFVLQCFRAEAFATMLAAKTLKGTRVTPSSESSILNDEVGFLIKKTLIIWAVVVHGSTNCMKVNEMKNLSY